MSLTAIPELFVSLSVQVTVIIGVCGWLVRQSDSADTGHRLWDVCQILVLMLTLSALLFPHLRVLPHSVISSTLPLESAALAENWLGGTLLIAWGVWATLYLMAILIGIWEVRRLITSAEPCSATTSLDTEGVDILVSSRVSSPFCWQMQRPVIVLPEIVRDFSPGEFEAVIRHELVHLRSGHPVSLFVQRVVETLYWFHPLVWWSSRQAELSREFHCDQVSNSDAQQIADYLLSLLRICEASTGPRWGLPAELSFQGRPSTIRQLVDRLMGTRIHQRSRQARRQVGYLVLTVIALVLSTVWLPLNVSASSRSVWSPWPRCSAMAL